jgi:hypothetical protein
MGDDDKDALYPLKDVLAAVEHEDVVRHTDAIKEAVSGFGLSEMGELAGLAQKAPDIVNQGLKKGFMGMLRDSMNSVAEDARRKAVEKGIDVDAEMLRITAEELRSEHEEL